MKAKNKKILISAIVLILAVVSEINLKPNSLLDVVHATFIQVSI